ncbi:MAG: pirin family protein [Ignavibacteriales bacterium]|nr:pirin family protein [Ignavibacteriales bacterium]
MVGPFIFMDHGGPVAEKPSTVNSLDVLPHPHIGLSTVSYLFSGKVTHRDSLGVEQVIQPGEVNWMTAGKGIAHSERFEDPNLWAAGGFEMIQTCCSS